jgi:hypothetical protein
MLACLNERKEYQSITDVSYLSKGSVAVDE